MRKLLKQLNVIQEVSNEGRSPRLGRGYFTAHRLNPFNPLSYIVFIIGFCFGILLFGIIGIWQEVDNKNPFKWN